MVFSLQLWAQLWDSLVFNEDFFFKFSEHISGEAYQNEAEEKNFVFQFKDELFSIIFVL